EFGLLVRKFSPTGLDGLPSTIKCGKQDANGVRIKYAALYVIVEKLEHLFRSPSGRGYIAHLLESWRVLVRCSASRTRLGDREHCHLVLIADPLSVGPPVGGTFHFENLVMPPLPKTCPKMVLSHKAVALCERCFAKKNFLVPGEIPLAARSHPFF